MPKPIAKNYNAIVTEPLEGKDWEKILHIGTQKLDKLGFNWQLGWGTLLGAVREKEQYIKHEIDLDVDILVPEIDKDYTERVEELTENFLNNGFILLRTQVYDNLQMSSAFLHEDSKIIFDLCFFYGIWGEDLLHIGTKGIAIRPRYTLKSKQLMINNRPYHIPEKYDWYLKGHYGSDWKKPKESKGDWFTDAKKFFIPIEF